MLDSAIRDRLDNAQGQVATPTLRLVRTIAWAGVLAITILSLLPGQERPETGLPGAVEHFLAYGCTGAALSFAYRGLRERLALWACLALASGLFEILQNFVPGRTSDVGDIVASTSGLTVGLVLGAKIARMLANRSSPVAEESLP